MGRSRSAEKLLEELAVGRGGRLAFAWPRFVARPVGWSGLGSQAGAALPGIKNAQGSGGSAVDRTNAERDPLGGILEAVGFGIAAGVDLVEALRLDPHPLALEQPEDARLTWLRTFILAVRAGG